MTRPPDLIHRVQYGNRIAPSSLVPPFPFTPQESSLVDRRMGYPGADFLLLYRLRNAALQIAHGSRHSRRFHRAYRVGSRSC